MTGELPAGAFVPDRKPDEAARHLRVLGLGPGASWDEICDAHRRLVADLTPGAGASHPNVALAESFLREVNDAFSSLRIHSVV
ncbi:MAG: hypothetical protein AAF547_24385 [Actinomycetota bacterium]